MKTERLYFLDWLRILAVLMLIFFHTGLIFSAQTNFHIKNQELSGAMEEILFFVHEWRLTLLFFISGVGTSFALGFRSKSMYMKERFRRLFIPLLFGILVIVPPQIYFERLQQGFAYDSFGSFYLESFSTGLYPYGNISWHHLWFVAYLLIYSVLSIPIFNTLRNRPVAWFENLTDKTGIILWAIPLALVAVSLKPISTGVQNIVNDLSMFFFYWLVFMAGFAVNQKTYWRFFEKKLSDLLIIAIILTSFVYFFKWNFPLLNKEHSLYFVYNFIRICNAWLWLLTLLALGKKYLNIPAKWLPVLNESVYPVYILHQTVIICLGYFVIQQDWTITAKFLIISFATVFICLMLYFIFRTNKITRIFFGMKV